MVSAHPSTAMSCEARQPGQRRGTSAGRAAPHLGGHKKVEDEEDGGEQGHVLQQDLDDRADGNHAGAHKQLAGDHPVPPVGQGVHQRRPQQLRGGVRRAAQGKAAQRRRSDPHCRQLRPLAHLGGVGPGDEGELGLLAVARATLHQHERHRVRQSHRDALKSVKDEEQRDAPLVLAPGRLGDAVPVIVGLDDWGWSLGVSPGSDPHSRAYNVDFVILAGDRASQLLDLSPYRRAERQRRMQPSPRTPQPRAAATCAETHLVAIGHVDVRRPHSRGTSQREVAK